MRKFLLQAIAAIVVVLGVSATPASAQASRTWVSGVGDDANPCSRTAPCRTLAGAISKTASGGEINVLDPTPLGAVTITKPITIRGEGTLGSVLASGTNGIVINLPSAANRVVIQDIEIEGLNQSGASPCLAGIRMVSAGVLVVEDVTIRGCTNGVQIDTTGTAELTVANSRIIGSTEYGVSIANVAGRSRAWITGTLLTNNALGQIHVNGPTNVLNLSGSVFSGRVPSFLLENGGRVNSYGDNAFPDVPAAGYTLVSRN